MSVFFYGLDLWAIATTVMLLFAGAALLGHWLGGRLRKTEQPQESGIGLLTGGALGLLGLLIAFSFSNALAGYNVRRATAVEEATALKSAAHNALLLPETQRSTVMPLLREYAEIRSRLGVPYDPARIPYDEDQSVGLLSKIWKQAVTASAADRQSPAIEGFVASVDHLSAVHETRAAELHNHVPLAVLTALLVASVAALAFTGFHVGMAGGRQTGPPLVMALALAFAIILVIDLDKPGRGSFLAQRQALDSALRQLTAMSQSRE